MKANNNLTPFQQALVNSVLKEYDAILTDAPKTEPSPKMQKWMKNEVETSRKRVNAHRIIRNILIAAIITALLAFSAMAVPVVRDAIIRFFLSEETDHFIVTFDPQQAATAPEEITNYYDIPYIPDNFLLTVEDKSPSSYIIIWFSDDGGFIQYIQSIIPSDATDDNWIGIDFDDDPQSRVIEGYDVKIIPGKESNIWVWTNNEYIFTLELPTTLTEEEITKIITSWVPEQ